MASKIHKTKKIASRRSKNKTKDSTKLASESTLFALQEYSKPKREPPRSANLFKIGPPFNLILNHNYILTSDGNFIRPVISARIDRGFDFVDNEWMGYKRNYFTAVVSFQFNGVTNKLALKQSFMCTGPDTSSEKNSVDYFMIRLGCECVGPNEADVRLVQHTAKRDHGPQNEPPSYNLIPGILPDHFVIRRISNVRNNIRISESDKYFYLDELNRNSLLQSGTNKLLEKYPPSEKVCIAAKYDRIQFQFAPSLTAKRNTNTRFALKMDLLACLTGGKVVKIVTAKTPCLLIRSRSPSTYASLSSVAPCQANDHQVCQHQQKEIQEIEMMKRNEAKKLAESKVLYENHFELNRIAKNREARETKLDDPFDLPLKSIEMNNFYNRLASFFAKEGRPKSQKLQAVTCGIWKDKQHQTSQLFVKIHCNKLYAQKRIKRYTPFHPECTPRQTSISSHNIEDQSIYAPAPMETSIKCRKQKSSNNSFQLMSPFLEVSADRPYSGCLKITSSENGDTANEQWKPMPEKSAFSIAKVSQHSTLSSFERLDRAMKAYETAKVELEALNQLGSSCKISDYDSRTETPMIPFQKFLLEQVSTSTPLLAHYPITPLAIPEAIFKRGRCVHGMLKREKSGISRVFTEKDHENTDDLSFMQLTKELKSRRNLLRQLTPSFDAELTLSHISFSQAGFSFF